MSHRRLIRSIREHNGVETNLTRFYLVFIIIFDLKLINTSPLSLSRYIYAYCIAVFAVVESVR